MANTQTEEGIAQRLKCYDYIFGVADAYNMLRGGESSGEGCMPRGVPGKQIHDVVVQFLQATSRVSPQTNPRQFGGCSR
jgi:predicted solute-binding protein